MAKEATLTPIRPSTRKPSADALDHLGGAPEGDSFDAPTAKPAEAATTSEGKRAVVRKGSGAVTTISGFVSVEAKQMLERLALVSGHDKQEIMELAIREYHERHPVSAEQLLAALGA
jgi:hypothetical protein